MATIDKVAASAAAAVADIPDGASILLGGFGVIQSWPISLITALHRRGVRNLTIICNTPGVGPTSPQILAENHQITRLIASFAAYPTRPTPVEAAIKSGEIELELVPQGTLIERVRAGGAGLAAFYTPTAVGTGAAKGKEERVFDGRRYVLETAIYADFALIRGATADRCGNVVYRRGARNFNPVFATGAKTTVVEVERIVEAGEIDPEAVITPHIFVDRVVRSEQPLDLAAIRELSRRYGKQWRLEARQAEGAPQGLPPELMARKAATLLRPREYVNLGLGIPTLLSSFLDPDKQVTLHSENGMLGFGPLVTGDDEDVDLYNASGQLVSQLPGAAYFHSCDAFAMARSGRVSTVVLGAFQVSEKGDLANWNVPHTGVGGIGGAMDLAAGNARILVVMFHQTREGEPKLLRECTYPLTAIGCVSTIVTDLAVIDVDAEGFLLRELAPGITIDDVKRVTAAPLRIAGDVREMEFG
ncbi:MAG TPA: 3-oxoacid CoA-transferase subunit B [Candidatus Acidoferrales bacterium]|nr:3-oxoacid CoA-transferase subunit B [Candidatus Acidoferrales bacterium]